MANNSLTNICEYNSSLRYAHFKWFMHILQFTISYLSRLNLHPRFTPQQYNWNLVFRKGRASLSFYYSTGLPKPAIIHQAKALGMSKFLYMASLVPDDIVYTVTPLYHSVAVIAVFCTMARGEYWMLLLILDFTFFGYMNDNSYIYKSTQIKKAILSEVYRIVIRHK